MTISDPAFLDRLRAATAVLEELVADRALLAGVPPDDQRRLLQAAGQVYSPDAIARRRLVRATMRQRKATKVLPRGGGARRHRHPDAPPPAGVHHVPTSSRRRSSSSAKWPTIPTSASRSSRSTATSASGSTPTIHHFYDQLCPTCAEFNFAKRTELADLTRPGGAAHRRAGQDRLPGRAQAAARRRAADRHHALSPRLGRALRPRSPTSPSGATGSRSSGSTCATRRASRRSATSCWRRATGSTSSSTTPARPCAARPSSTST